jgi:hypothetical protein
LPSGVGEAGVPLAAAVGPGVGVGAAALVSGVVMVEQIVVTLFTAGVDRPRQRVQVGRDGANTLKLRWNRAPKPVAETFQ